MLEPVADLTDASPGPDLSGDAEAQPDAAVRCRCCGHSLTARSRAVAVNGAHEHTFRNPAGYSFHVACYADAPGCLRVGEPTSEATWFPGYDWCFALCGQCREHLGWWYAAPADSFAGLIATRLAGR